MAPRITSMRPPSSAATGRTSRNGDRAPGTEEKIFQPLNGRHHDLIPADIFDEAGYLRLNPDVRHAIELGEIESGYAHYVTHGNTEGRALPGVPLESRNVMLPSAAAALATDVSGAPARCSVDALIIAPNDKPERTSDVHGPIVDISETGWSVAQITDFRCICGPMMAAFAYSYTQEYFAAPMTSVSVS